jgi:D-alanyl-D-alanine dipeptidase
MINITKVSIVIGLVLLSVGLYAQSTKAVESKSAKKVNYCEDLPTRWTELKRLDSTILQDIRYATTNNFTKSVIYDCPKCFLRPDVAKSLVTVHKKLKAKGLGLKVFDCYRPSPYQQKLWDKVPDPNYVTPPAKGSMHSRGAAVDLTIVDKAGKELDMGTPYDFFGKEAHHTYTGHSKKVQENRALLKSLMEEAGFNSIRTEWWHYSINGGDFLDLSSRLWKCN